MKFTRRDIVKAGAAAAALASIPRPLRALAGPRHAAPAIIVTAPEVKELALRAMEVARTAGAAYADVRLTLIRDRSLRPLTMASDDKLRMHVGVRALVNGYWGFASSSYWTPDEVARAARESVALARTNALGKPRAVELAPVPVVSDGNWQMPVKVDPFSISPVDLIDFGNGIDEFARRNFQLLELHDLVFDFAREEKAFASTDGSYLTQTTYRTGAKVEVPHPGGTIFKLDALPPAGAGWEYIRDARVPDLLVSGMEQLTEVGRLPVKPVEVGRYDVVFDAASMAALLHGTIGPATELDRAMGFEANASGTSYLDDPLAMLGSHQVGSSLVNVTADRSQPGGLATVKWDDEGVEPDRCTLVENGVLNDFQTTRESAGWLKEWYASAGREQRSHGCAAAASAGNATMLHSANIALLPAAAAASADDLESALKHGIAIHGATISGDFNGVGGSGSGEAYEIRDGKRVARLRGAGFLFRTPELWKGVQAIGGAASQRWFGFSADKGEPAQNCWSSVGAVPASVKQVTVIDIARKA